MNLFDVDNIRQHAADVGVSAHALHRWAWTRERRRTAWRWFSTPGPVRAISPRLSSTEVPEGSSLRRRRIGREGGGAKDFIEAHEAADSEETAAELAQKVGEMDPAGGRAQMLQELAQNVGGGFKTSSGGPARA